MSSVLAIAVQNMPSILVQAVYILRGEFLFLVKIVRVIRTYKTSQMPRDICSYQQYFLQRSC